MSYTWDDMTICRGWGKGHDDGVLPYCTFFGSTEPSPATSSHKLSHLLEAKPRLYMSPTLAFRRPKQPLISCCSTSQSSHRHERVLDLWRQQTLILKIISPVTAPHFVSQLAPLGQFRARAVWTGTQLYGLNIRLTKHRILNWTRAEPCRHAKVRCGMWNKQAQGFSMFPRPAKTPHSRNAFNQREQHIGLNQTGNEQTVYYESKYPDRLLTSAKRPWWDGSTGWLLQLYNSECWSPASVIPHQLQSCMQGFCSPAANGKTVLTFQMPSCER